MFPYFGGKAYLADWIIQHFPLHDIYVEVFGGAGWVLWKKEPAKTNIYNEKDPYLANVIFWLTTDPEAVEREGAALKSTDNLWPRLWEWLQENFSKSAKDAAIYLWMIKQNFSASWEIRKNALISVGRIREVHYTVELAKQVIKRIKNLHILNRDAIEVIRRFDVYDNVLFYCDPPYVGKEHNYRIGKNEKDIHQRLADVLNSIRNRAVVSYYWFDGIEDLYPPSRWFYDFKEAVKHSALAALGKEKPVGREVLIMNYDWKKLAKKTKTLPLEAFL